MARNSKEEIQKTICLPSTVEETSIVYIKEEDDVKNETFSLQILNFFFTEFKICKEKV